MWMHFFKKKFVACGFGIVVENSQKGQRGIDFCLSELKVLIHIQSVSMCDLSIREESFFTVLWYMQSQLHVLIV